MANNMIRTIIICFFMGLLCYGWIIAFYAGVRTRRTSRGKWLLLIGLFWLSGLAYHAYHEVVQDAMNIVILLLCMIFLIVEWVCFFGWIILFAVGIRRLQKLSGKIFIVIAGIWLSGVIMISAMVINASICMGKMDEYYIDCDYPQKLDKHIRWIAVV